VRLDPYEPEPRHPERSCVAVTFAANFPKIVIGPHTHMSRLRQRTAWKSVRSLSESFKDRYSIDATDAAGVAVVIGPEVADWLSSQKLDARLEIQGGALLGHVARLDEDDFTELTDLVQGVHRRIPEAAWAEFSLFKLP